MSKIAEQKALEAYPISINKDSVEEGFDWNEEYREVYIQGYDQAMQDFLEKAKELIYEQFNIHPHDCHVVQHVSDKPLETIDDFIDDFKNYIENESEN